MNKLLDDLEARGFQVTRDPKLARAQSQAMAGLMREAWTGLIRHSIWFAIVLVSLHMWASFGVEHLAVNFAVAVLALYSVFNPPEAFHSIRNSSLPQE